MSVSKALKTLSMVSSERFGGSDAVWSVGRGVLRGFTDSSGLSVS